MVKSRALPLTGLALLKAAENGVLLTRAEGGGNQVTINAQAAVETQGKASSQAAQATSSQASQNVENQIDSFLATNNKYVKELLGPESFAQTNSGHEVDDESTCFFFSVP